MDMSLNSGFSKTGDSDLELRFDFPPEKEEQIRKELVEKNRSTPVFEYGFYPKDGVMCTKVECVVAIREKNYGKAI